MALVGSVTGSVNLGGASTFISSSNGSSVEIGAATQVLVLSGGSASSLDPRNMLDTNFFVSGSIGTGGSTTRGNATFGGPVFVSGTLVFGGDSTFPSAISSLFNIGQNAYWQASYPVNPAVFIAGKSNSILLAYTLIASTNYLYGRTRIGSTSAGPTAYLHITASNGSVGYAPIKLDSGSLLASPEAGAIEYDSSRLYLTDGSSTRRNILMSGDVTGTFNDSLGRMATTASVSFAGSRGAAYFASSSVGGDVFFFVSGTSGLKDQINSGKVSVFGGDVVVSGTIFGGASFGTSTSLTLRSSKIQVTANALGFGQSGGNDVAFFVSGSPGSRNGATPGTALFGGDVTISGSLLSNDLITTTGNIIGAPGSGNNVMSLLSSGNITARLDVDNNGVGHKFEVQDYLANSMFRVGEDGNAFLSGTLNVSGSIISTGTVSFAGSRGLLYSASSVGTDVFFFASGSTAAKDGAVPGVAVFGGASVFSGSIFGGYSFPASATSLDIVAQRISFKGTSGQPIAGSDTSFFVSGAVGSKGTATRGSAVFNGDLLTSGAMYLGTTVESMGLTSSVGAGTSTFDVSQQSIFYLSGTTSDFTANFTNVPTISGRVVSVNLLVTQSATAYKPTAVQIGGVAQTLLWANGVVPTANANKQDVFGFSLVRSGANWAVLGQMSTYG